jgi:hypothetical protein
MACTVVEDRSLCTYPGAIPGSTGAACDPERDVEQCLVLCLAGDNVCTDVCDDSSACPSGYTCEAWAENPGTRLCHPARGDGCAADGRAPIGLLVVLLGALAMRPRRRATSPEA